MIAALKDLAIAQKRQGISLTCHDYLIAYYEMNGLLMRENQNQIMVEALGIIWSGRPRNPLISVLRYCDKGPIDLH